MNNRELFLNDTSPICIYTGGAGKGGSHTGLLKLKPYLEQGMSCAVVRSNMKDILVGGGVLSQAEDLFYEIVVSKSKVDKVLHTINGGSLRFLPASSLMGMKFDYVFVDSASQVDEKYSLDYFLRSVNNRIWFNTNSTKNRGFIFDLLEDYLEDCGEYYEFNKFYESPTNQIKVIHGTCLDNPELLSLYPNYIKTLASQSKIMKGKLLNGYYYKE